MIGDRFGKESIYGIRPHLLHNVSPQQKNFSAGHRFRGWGLTFYANCTDNNKARLIPRQADAALQSVLLRVRDDRPALLRHIVEQRAGSKSVSFNRHGAGCFRLSFCGFGARTQGVAAHRLPQMHWPRSVCAAQLLRERVSLLWNLSVG